MKTKILLISFSLFVALFLSVSSLTYADFSFVPTATVTPTRTATYYLGMFELGPDSWGTINIDHPSNTSGIYAYYHTVVHSPPPGLIHVGWVVTLTEPTDFGIQRSVSASGAASQWWSNTNDTSFYNGTVVVCYAPYYGGFTPDQICAQVAPNKQWQATTGTPVSYPSVGIHSWWCYSAPANNGTCTMEGLRPIYFRTAANTATPAPPTATPSPLPSDTPPPTSTPNPSATSFCPVMILPGTSVPIDWLRSCSACVATLTPGGGFFTSTPNPTLTPYPSPTCAHLPCPLVPIPATRVPTSTPSATPPTSVPSFCALPVPTMPPPLVDGDPVIVIGETFCYQFTSHPAWLPSSLPFIGGGGVSFQIPDTGVCIRLAESDTFTIMGFDLPISDLSGAVVVIFFLLLITRI